jgi:chemotaxis protein methyltransferase WspC
LPSNRFVTSGSPSLGIYRRAAASGAVTPDETSIRPAAPKPVSRSATAAQQGVQRLEASTYPAPPERTVAPTSLEGARKLADAGQLAAARSMCERLLAQTTGDPNIYSLLGVVDLAEGRAAEAAKSFRKAIYLDPNHPEALSHMIVICDSTGDTAQATALRKRLARSVREEQV